MPEGAGLEAKNVAGAMTSMHIDELISNLAIGIAEGQMRLDETCMEIAQFMSQAQVDFGKRAGSDEPDLISLIELGFSPNFYQFVDTILEVRVSVSSQFEETREYDTSQTNMHQDESQSQNQYASSSSSGGSSSSSGQSWDGWWGGARASQSSSHSYSNRSSYSGGSSSSKRKNISLTTVDAKYASTYNYAVEGSSLVKTKIVPVPPPQVFDEIVRAKLKERREWEQRMRWQDQAKSNLTAAFNSAGTMTADIDALKKKPTDVKQENASDLQTVLLDLQEGYNRMTTDHWAVITGSVSLREAADKALKKSVDNAQKLTDLFADPDSTPEPTDVEDTLETLSANLETFKSRIKDIKKKLPSEEEETGEENTQEASAETQQQDTGESDEVEDTTGTDTGS